MEKRKEMFILSSITYVIKAKDLLNAKGIKCETIRVSNSEVLAGCGYGILIHEKIDEAEKILKNSKIKILWKKIMEAKL